MLARQWTATRVGPTSAGRRGNGRYGLRCRAEALPVHSNGGAEEEKKRSTRKKVIVVGSGWAGLGAAHHLCKQGFDVTVFEDGDDSGSSDHVGIRGFWYPYKNIFSLVDELGIEPFSDWTKSAQYSREGLEVEFPIFQDLPQLPSPFGPLVHSRFLRLELADRLSSIPLLAPVIDFDNTDRAWRKYDPITARELFRQFGCSDRLYKDVFAPLLQVGLFAPPEQCSAAAALAMLYYLVIAHQKDFDVKWCRGSVREKIFQPWIDSMRTDGCEFLSNKKVTDFCLDEETGQISGVVCGSETYDADAVIVAVRVSALQDIIKSSAVVCTRDEFLKVLNLAGIDVLTAQLKLDRKVSIPNTSNACEGFDDCFGWTFFDLNVLHNEHKEDPGQVIQTDFYHANQLLPLDDELLVGKITSNLSKFLSGIENAIVVGRKIRRFPRSLTHFFPGSYKYMLQGSTSFPNLFLAGDWIITRHGSWSQEKAYVTGLEAANLAVDYLGHGEFARIIPVEEDEPHIQTLRDLNRSLNDFGAQLPFSDFFM